MSARAASSALILSLLIAPGFFRPAQAGPWLPAPGEYCTELRGGLFNADTYRNNDGKRTPLGGEWEERSILGTVELGWKKNVSVVFAAPFIGTTGMAGVGSATSTGLEDLGLGLRVGLMRGPTALAAELDWQTPLGYDRESSMFADSLRGGGFQQLSLSLLFGRPIARRGFMQLGAGAGIRSGSGVGDDEIIAQLFADAKSHWLSQQDASFSPSATTLVAAANCAEYQSLPLMASADLGLWVTRSLLLCARYSGVTVLANKEFTVPMASSGGVPLIPGGPVQPWNYEVSGVVRARHLAGMSLVWRVDERLDLTAGSWSTMMARNSLHYDQVYVALTFKQTSLNRLQGFLGGTKAP